MRDRRVGLLSLLLLCLLMASCASVGIQYRKYTGDIQSILILSDHAELAQLLNADLSRSRYKTGVSETRLAGQVPTDAELKAFRSRGYDSVLLLRVAVGGDGRPNAAVFNVIDTSNGQKCLAGTWTGSGDDYTTYGYDPSPEYKTLILEGRKTFTEASSEICSRLVKEIPQGWW